MDLQEFQQEFERLQAGVAPEARDGAVDLHMIKAFKRLGLPTAEGVPGEVCTLVNGLRPSWDYESLVMAFQTRYEEIKTEDILDEVWHGVSSKLTRTPGWGVEAILKIARGLDANLAEYRKRGKDGIGFVLPQDRIAAMMGIRQQAVSHAIQFLLKREFIHILVKADRGKRIATRYGLGAAKMAMPEQPTDFR